MLLPRQWNHRASSAPLAALLAASLALGAPALRALADQKRPGKKNQTASPQLAPVTPPPPGSSAPATTSVAPGPAAPPNGQWGNWEWDNWHHDEQTGEDSGRNFVYTEKDTVVTGALAKYNDRTKMAHAEKNLTLDDPKHHATGDKA